MPTVAQRERSEQLSGFRGRVTAERLREVLHYDPGTGVFTRRKDSANHISRAGDVAGCATTVTSGHEYRQIHIDGRNYWAHVLAVLYVTGQWPKEMVSHWNQNGLDNRWVNLRQASNAALQHDNLEPLQSNSTGFRGVRPGHNGRFEALIKVDMRKRYLGAFDTAEEASDVYLMTKLLVRESLQDASPG